MLIDRAVIFVRSGKGGAGAVSFRREKYIPKGGPTGGDGGRGGDVVLEATAGVDTLLDFSGRHHWDAPAGEPGGSKQCAGRDAADLVVKLPPGTLVYDENTGELLADMDEPGKRLVICRGGRGGWGNEHFKSSTNQAPRTTTPGGAGEERLLRLELKLIADIGLIGKPNAGKSTLLSRISKAHPKIADYPFTTIEPNLGIAELTGYRRMVIADLPGLIEGAHQGAGLGIQFLRHVERTRLLVHLIEVVPGDGSDPVKNYRVIRRELAKYSKALAKTPEIIVISKMDVLLTVKERATAKKKIEAKLKKKTFVVSAATGDGLPKLLEECWKKLGKDKPVTAWREREEKTKSRRTRGTV